jgi:hypothetical protein|tara:strand:+ start:168 stop:1736 length:1569 start_codon:yes stop_codon:yes gene_type:complete
VDVNGMTFAREDADELKGLLSSGRGRGGDAPRRRAGTRARESGEGKGARGRVMHAVGAKEGEVRKSARGKSRLGSERRAATEAKTTRDVGEDEREDAGEGGGNGGAVRAADTVDDAEAMRAAMLVRQPSLKSIKTKVEREPVVAEERGQGGSTIALGGSARYRANCGRAIGRGVNFDEDGNTPRSGGDGEMLGSIDSGTPTFFRDQLLKDIPHPVARPFAYPQPGETPGSADNPYFNNTELADLLSIVHGQPSANMAETPRDLNALNTPTLAEVNMLSGGSYWDQRNGERNLPSPSVDRTTKKRKSSLGAGPSAKKARPEKKSAGTLSKEEEAFKKMKAFSTRGSNLRTVEDEELMDSLVDVHGNALTDEMKYSCLDYNARVVDLNNQHEAATAASSAKREDEEVQAKSRSWTHAEDALVRDLVKQHGPKKWAVIAERLSGKTQKQVYARWRDYLQPGLTTRAWEPFEEEHLIQIQEVIGNQWAVLARLMPGRSPNAIKNKFHATRRKFERKGDHFDDDGDE